MDLLSPTIYFRFNPELSEDIAIDESNPAKLEQLVDDANGYIDSNEEELQRAISCLLAPKKPSQKAQEWVNAQWNSMLSRTSHWTNR